MTPPVFVLGLHPSARGLGWVLFEGADALFDCGSVEIHGSDKNGKALARVERLLDKYRPAVLVLEDSDGKASRRKPRLRRLYRSLITRAQRHGVAVHLYARGEITDALGLADGGRRHDVAAVVAERVEALRPRLPRPQKIWLGESHHMGLFCAAACVLTHYAREVASAE